MTTSIGEVVFWATTGGLLAGSIAVFAIYLYELFLRKRKEKQMSEQQPIKDRGVPLQLQSGEMAELFVKHNRKQVAVGGRKRLAGSTTVKVVVAGIEFEATTKCSKHDPFEKAVGRGEAGKKLLSVLPSTFTKNDKTLIMLSLRPKFSLKVPKSEGTNDQESEMKNA